MPEVSIRSNEQYSGWVGSVFIFNLIVGTGALTLPFAFSKAGWLVSFVVIVVLAFMSYVTTTFVIESMATANAIIQWRKLQQIKKVDYELPDATSMAVVDYDTGQHIKEPPDDASELSQEDTPLLEGEPCNHVIDSDLYKIQEKVEMGQMVSLFFNKAGVVLFYCCMCIYLFGDLAIYGAAVAKSLRDITCVYVPSNQSCNETIKKDVNCWENVDLSRQNAYRVYVTMFVVLLGPFVFFNVQKTKYLQILTTLLRWIAFLTMIILAVIQLSKGYGRGHPPIGDFTGVPRLFGVCVYSFMCHHSLPSLVTPISGKNRLSLLFALDYVAILTFYLLLGFTGVFTFSSLSDLYTLNFQPNKCQTDDPESITSIAFVRYFLALFPVFTLSTNFPIIGITLRNNLQSLFLGDTQNRNFYLRRILFPLVTILPPTAVAIISEDVGFLVDFTGSYAGTGIQYIVPTLLAYKSRQLAKDTVGSFVKNVHLSPFRHRWWVVFVLLWAASCVIIVTVNHFITS